MTSTTRSHGSSTSTSISRRRRNASVAVLVAGFLIPISFVVVLRLRSESSAIRNSFSVDSSKPSLTSSLLSSATKAIDDTVPNLIECLDKCLYFGYPSGCFNSSGVALRGDNRWTDEWKQVTDSNSLVMPIKKNYNGVESYTNVNTTTTILTGDIVVVLKIHTPLRNINHIFHDDFWSILSYFSQPSTLQPQYADDAALSNTVVNVTFVHDYTSRWLIGLLDVIIQAYPWWNVIPQLPSYDDRWICTSLPNQHKLYVNGYIRNMHNYQLHELSRIRNDLRTVAYSDVSKLNSQSKLLENANVTATAAISKEWIVIYTREDGPTRQIHDTEKIVDALDADRYAIHIQRYMPSNFSEQVAMFALADLLIAPNGGWTPNVLWMKDTACLVEIHLYDTNSWLVKYGLSSLFQPAHHVQIVTGDYHNITINGPRLNLPNRHGGDDEIQGSMVISDIVHKLQQSPDCQRFLRKH
jgi:Glycosyltransferase 61